MPGLSVDIARYGLHRLAVPVTMLDKTFRRPKTHQLAPLDSLHAGYATPLPKPVAVQGPRRIRAGWFPARVLREPCRQCGQTMLVNDLESHLRTVWQVAKLTREIAARSHARHGVDRREVGDLKLAAQNKRAFWN